MKTEFKRVAKDYNIGKKMVDSEELILILNPDFKIFSLTNDITS